jgi:signal transduction histidine kinase/ligand-binding sensor domain-containing protein
MVRAVAACGVGAALLVALRATPLLAQPSLTLLRQWNIADGLPQSSTTELVMDRNGAIWAATFGGLVRFDGHSVETFGLDRLPFLTSNRVSALAMSRNNTLWLGTPEGRIVRLRDGIPVDSLPATPAGVRGIDVLLEDSDGTLWTRVGDMVATWNGRRWTMVTDAVMQSFINLPMMEWSRGTVLLSDMDTLRLFDANGGVRRTIALRGVQDSSQPRNVTALLRDSLGYLWLGTRESLYRTTGPVTLRTQGPADTLSLVRVISNYGRVSSLAHDPMGGLLVATNSSLVRVSAGGANGANGANGARARWRVERIPLPGGNGNLTSLLQTRDGAMVVGTFGEGLLVYAPSAVQHLTRADGLVLDEVPAVASDGQGGALVSGGCNPLVRLAPVTEDGTTVFRVRDSLALPVNQCVRSITADRRGNWWLGTNNAILRRDVRGTLTTWSIPGMRDDQVVRTLLHDGSALIAGVDDGRIYVIGTDDQLRPLPGWAMETAMSVSALARAPDGALWIGVLDGGVYRVSSDRTVRLSRDDGVPAGEIRVLRPEADGSVWVGSYGDGLARINPDLSVRRWRLPDGTVSSLLMDDSGQLWMLGNRGVSVVSRARLDAADSPVVEVRANLLTDRNEVYEGNAGFPAAAALSNRHFAFSSVNGMSIVDVERMARAQPPASLVVTEVRSTGRRLMVRDTLIVTPDARTLYVRLSAPSYADPEGLRFRYQVAGRDDGWIEVGTQRELQLASLPPGDFQLLAQVQSADGQWLSARPVALRVTARWYETVWARVLAGLVLGVAVLVAVRWQLNLVRERAVALEQQMEERRALAEATERHQRELAAVGRVALAGEMSASLAHELGQPLSAIMNDAEVAKRMLARGADASALKPVIDHLVAQSERARSVIRALRGFLAPEGGTVSLTGSGGSADAESAGTRARGGRRTETIAVRTLLRSAEDLVRQEYRDAGITLETEVWEPKLSVRGERVLLEQIVVNLLTNAADAVRGRGERRVGVRARKSGAGVRITVIDSGPGVALSERTRVFAPFVSEKPRGMGMGLTIVRRLVEGHEGRIAVRRGPYGGAAFSVWLPAGRTRGENA